MKLLTYPPITTFYAPYVCIIDFRIINQLIQQVEVHFTLHLNYR